MTYKTLIMTCKMSHWKNQVKIWSDDEENSQSNITPSAAATSSNDGSGGCNETGYSPQNFTFAENTGLKQESTSLKDFVDQFFPEEFWIMLMDWSDFLCSQKIHENGPVWRISGMTMWKETNFQEIKVFWRLLLQLRPCTFPKLKSYWGTNVLYQTPPLVIRNELK